MADGADFLYPFLGADGDDPTALLDDLAASAVGKAEVSAALQAAALEANAATLAAAADDMAERFAAGGVLLTFGNGGSATDAAGLAALFRQPPAGRSRPARCLVEDQAVLTALGNDVGFDLVFARQVIAHGREVDIALGASTSGNSRNLLAAFEAAGGNSRNLLAAFEAADARGLLTVGLAGYDGGEMARSPHVRHCLVVAADSIHRIQEAQAALGFALWRAVEERAGAAARG
jgi:D-sedoheptulose 7-phosphate isomerase